MEEKEVLYLYTIDTKYINQLREIDLKILQNKDDSNIRPYTGIVLKENGLDYFIPLKSPKPKHINMKKNIDFMKIDEGRLGALDLNLMIPVKSQYLQKIRFDFSQRENDSRYTALLEEQLTWLRKNTDEIKTKARNLLHKYKTNKLPEKIKNRCVDFPKLEKALLVEKSKVQAQIKPPIVFEKIPPAITKGRGRER